jgi:hypothetical protein
MTTVTILAGATGIGLVVRPASAADNPYQRGPDPTVASVAASRGTFATTETTVGSGNGFGAARIYYPTDTSQGRFGAIAIVPGYTATGPLSIFLVCAFLNMSFGTLRFLRGMARFHLLHYNSCKI